VSHRFLRSATFLLLAAAGLNAHAAPCPTTATTTLVSVPPAAVGASFSLPFSASNSNALPFVFTVTGGLPAGSGLAMTPTGTTSANLAGSPTQAGSYLVTVTATDSAGCSGGRTVALAVGQGSQTINFTSSAPSSAQIGGAPYTVAATASSGLPVSFAIAAGSSSVCAITGSSVTFQSAGTCVINADQAGNANWAAAPQAQQSFGVGLASQTISFTTTAPSTATVGGTAYAVAATASSGLSVAFAIDASASSVCSLSGGNVTFQSVGTCVVNANQAGNASYNPAPQVQQTFTVGQGSQTISFTSTAPAAAMVGGASYTVTATATSGLPVSFSIAAGSSSVCAIAGSTVTFQGVGSCVVNANQAGNANYAAAPQVQQTFAVGQGSQTISFTSTAPAAATVGGASYTVTATATSGLPVSFSIAAGSSSVCAIAGSTVTFQSVGTCVINANQAGNANYAAAPQVQQTFAVGQGSQTISFSSTAPTTATVGGTSYTVAATATSGLPVSFSIAAGSGSVCAIAGSSVTFQSVGTCVVNANQAGDANWNAAPQAQQSFAVGQGSQTISFTSTAPTTATVGGASYTVAATATSGLPVSFSIAAGSSSVCTIAGSTVTFQSVGSCVVNANQAGNANYTAAPQVQQTFAVSQGSQTISFTSTVPTTAAVGGTAYTVSATATSGLPVSFTIAAGSSSVCTIAGSTVTFQSVGSCVVNANQAGNANYAAAPQVQQSFAVGQGSQTISFTSTAPTTATVGGTSYTVAATATSGLPVSFTIAAGSSSVCTIAGSTVTFQSVGSCVVNANQAGNANYAAAPEVQQTFAVGQGSQTISFTSTVPTTATVGGASYTVAATATSGLPVSFSIAAGSSSVCTIAGSTVTFQSVGSCVVNANQAGNANYAAAPQVQQTFAVGQGSQTISFTSTAPTTATVGGASYTVAATATSGLPVSFTIAAGSSSICAIAGSTVTFQSVGSCVVNANQAGNANYAAAPQVQQSFAVGQGSQTISFTSTAPTTATVGGASYTVAATATSGLPVSFSIAAGSSSVCTIAGSTVTFQGAGTCVINANQAGNANWNAAPQAQQTFAVGKASQTISFTTTAPAGATVAGTAYTVAATATSGLPVTLSIAPGATGVCTLSGSSVTFEHAGTCVINANQAGDANWNAAPQAQQSFTVGAGSQTISFTSTAPTGAQIGGPTYTVSATATSGLPVSFSIDPSSSAVCTIATDVVTFIGGGNCTINANQAGDSDWAPAPQAQQTFGVTSCLSLAIGQVVYGSMPAAANLCVAGDAAQATEYTLMPINDSASAETATLSLTGTNIQAVTGPPSPRPVETPLAPLQESSVDSHGGVPMPPAFADGRQPTAADFVARPEGGVVPLTVGQLIDINASIGSCGAAPDIRKGRVEAISASGAGQQLYYAVQEVQELVPGGGNWQPAVVGGFSAGQFQNLMDAFVQSPPGSTPTVGMLSSLKTGAHDLLTTNYGAMTDLDNNGGIIVFFTKKMNEQSPPASSAITSSLFQPRDLFSAATCGGSNEGEYIYTMVPDPTGSVNSNVRTVSFVYGSTTTWMVHNLSHLLNATRRLYFNGAAPLEQTWLDESLAMVMQELVFFNTSVGLTPRQNIVVTNLTTGPNASVRVAAFNTFENPLFGYARDYFFQVAGANSSKRAGPLMTTALNAATHDTTTASATATFLFLRYAMDRKNTGDAAIIGALVNSQLVGTANLQAVLNVDLKAWSHDFLVAMYTDDAVAGIAPEYTAPSWSYRSLYTALNGSYQLAVNPLTNGTPLNFVLRPGGGTRYARFGVAAGQTADLGLTEAGVTPTSPITMAIVRTK